MNGNRTEKPTPKKIRDSRRKGKVAKSSDLSGAAVFVVMILILGFFADDLLRIWAVYLRSIWSESVLLADEIDIDSLNLIIKNVLRLLLVFLVPIAGVCSLVVFLQVGPLFVPVKVDVKRIDISKGIKNIFSAKKFVDLLKMMAKFFVILVPGIVFWRQFVGKILSLTGQRMGLVAGLAGYRVMQILVSAGVLFVLFGILDYWLQYTRWYKDLKMKREEVKREMKDSEGDPGINQMRRQMHREMSLSGLEERVAGAGIVIVNPTSFAVALEYRSESGGVPRVLAKGAFEHAAEIRRLAGKHDVPVIRHPPLARQLFLLMIDQEIPENLFRAVAELLVYLIGLTENERRSCR